VGPEADSLLCDTQAAKPTVITKPILR